MHFCHAAFILSPLMRISVKMSLALSVLGLLVFGGLGWLQLETEARDLQRVAAHEADVLSMALANAVGSAIRDAQLQDSTRLLESLEATDRALEFAVVDSDGAPILQSEVDVELAALVAPHARAAIERQEVIRAQVSADLRNYRLSVRPFEQGGQRLAVAVLRPLDALEADLRRETWLVVTGVLAFSVLSGVLAYLLGELYIGRPLARLDRAMGQLGQGGLGLLVDERGRDEVGRLARRFNIMSTELMHAREDVQSQQEATRRAQTALQDADRLITVGQLSAGLAHEIGSPLQVLRGRAHRIVELSAEHPELARNAELICAQADRITRIVQQLLQFARSRRPELRECNPAAEITTVVDLLELEAKRRSVSIVADVAGTVTRVVTDPHRLQQIAFNLARNGLAAVEDHGHVRLRLEVVEAPSAGGGVGRELRLTVEDDGPGVRPEVREHLFEPFFTTRSGEGGIGLGLAVVRTLVTELGGDVDFSTGPTGTAFVVRLPADGRVRIE